VALDDGWTEACGEGRRQSTAGKTTKNLIILGHYFGTQNIRVSDIVC